MKKKYVILSATLASITALGLIVCLPVCLTQINKTNKTHDQYVPITPIDPIGNNDEKPVYVGLSNSNGRLIKANSYADKYLSINNDTKLHANQDYKILNNVQFTLADNESTILRELKSIDPDIGFIKHFLFVIVNDNNDQYVSNLLTKNTTNSYDLVFRPNKRNASLGRSKNYHIKYVAFLISIPSVAEHGVLLEKFVVWPLHTPIKIDPDTQIIPYQEDTNPYNNNQYDYSDYSTYDFDRPTQIKKRLHIHDHNGHHH
ncbi:hypothetical protein OF376_02850 [Ureaplasma miroungigenitalium]|uniref:Uncharacterized protein n=1 Tax=Ureaplasma miroungigenitalium TaxID=1042321 RepID=A0ABT3BNA0_9BACT|nr:hypothetical protein [Ureaplasma miroungigenitalium]MCV3728701.1 hypothetical protein [Ureaplasma miroungigenitalium]MCV3734465.1 hypothetical protein [Ureaplasma miroungigenitalium]